MFLRVFLKRIFRPRKGQKKVKYTDLRGKWRNCPKGSQAVSIVLAVRLAKKRSLVAAASATVLLLTPRLLVQSSAGCWLPPPSFLSRPLAQASAWRSLEPTRLEPNAHYTALCCRKSRKECLLCVESRVLNVLGAGYYHLLT